MVGNNLLQQCAHRMLYCFLTYHEWMIAGFREFHELSCCGEFRDRLTQWQRSMRIARSRLV